jgi:hypothetical protein
MKYYIGLFIVIVVGCTEKISLDIPQNDERIVLEGAITNENGPYFFRLSKSYSIYQANEADNSIQNATLIIKDNMGIVDTLKALSTEIYQHPKWYYYYILVENYSGQMDTIRLHGDNPSGINGVYYTTKIKGIPGNTYYLTIHSNNQIVQAQEYMPKVPDIDSVVFKTHYSEKDKQDFLVPYLFFKEPKNEKNYYMFNFGSDGLLNMLYRTTQVWNFSILNDEFLPEYVNGFNIDDGASPKGYEDFFYFSPGDSVHIRMLSLTENAYHYYESLLKQFENDGGAYTPTPSTPKSNLSNGALGYFRASAVSEKKIFVE